MSNVQQASFRGMILTGYIYIYMHRWDCESGLCPSRRAYGSSQSWTKITVGLQVNSSLTTVIGEVLDVFSVFH